MSKRKGQFRNRARFVSDLSIEQCVRQLEALQSDTVQIDMLAIASDRVDFRVRGFDKGRLRVDGRGTLIRWEGTKTRVDFQLTVHDGLLAFTLLTLLIFVMFIGVIPAMALLFSGVDGRLLLVFSAVFLSMMVGLMLLVHRFAPPDDVPMNVVAYIEIALQ